MKSMKQKRGFSLAETLIVVGIIVVLAALAAVLVMNYLRGMTKLEYDGYAKEIFVAAQNHLTMAEHEGYLGLKDDVDFGTCEQSGDTKLYSGDLHEKSNKGVYYIVVKDGAVVGNGAAMFSLMLPDGALADGKSLSGSYVIRYHKDSARVLDVFFWEEDVRGWTSRFNYSFKTSNAAAEYQNFLEQPLDTLREYTYDANSKKVIGYYGGATAGLSYLNDILAPSIYVENADVLRVLVTNPNDPTNTDIKITLKVTGKSSGAVKTFEITPGDRVRQIGTTNQYEVILDDITDIALHFASLAADSGTGFFVPGEDLDIEAFAFSTATDVVHNVAPSGLQTTNSLFDSIAKTGSNDTDPFDKAFVSNIRHLENLDNTISKVSLDPTSKFAISKAEQTTDLDFTDFKPNNTTSYTITKWNSSPTIGSGSFLPMNPTYALDYNGVGKTIKNVNVSGYNADAGLFGAPAAAISVHDLKLLDFNISGTNAGALAGTFAGGSVTNVIACNSQGNDAAFSSGSPNITGSASAGGLIGSQSGGSVTASAAALYVNGNSGTAGGFIGTMSGGSVTASYASGHTQGGAYQNTNYNVTGNTAGGFIGSMSGGAVTYSYSTCSAKGTAVAGGFVGSAASGSIGSSYCTGLVDAATEGAFAGSLSATATNCQYFSIINDTSMKAVSGQAATAGIAPFDDTTANYRAFVPTAANRTGATPYDSTLTAYYKGKYNLKSVKDLGASVAATDFVATHYGDWPAPEIFFVNTPTTP